MNANRLAEFIREHGHDAHVDAQGRIVATCDATRDGEVFQITETLPARLGAVRNWLGY